MITEFGEVSHGNQAKKDLAPGVGAADELEGPQLELLAHGARRPGAVSAESGAGTLGAAGKAGKATSTVFQEAWK